MKTSATFTPNTSKANTNKCKLLASLATASLVLGMSGCGGSTTEKVAEKINGAGGVYVGAFVEQDNDANDFDIGGIYFDIPKDIAGNVTGALSYQNLDCQDRNVLTIEGTKARKDLLLQPSFGNIDPKVSANNITLDASRSVGITFKASFDEAAAEPKPWGGTFDIQNTDKPKLRVSQACGGQTWTQAAEARFATYPVDKSFGISITFDSTSQVASWQAPAQTAKTLIIELDNARISTESSAFIKQTVSTSALSSYKPSDTSNTILIIMPFDSDNKLLGFDAQRIN